MIPRKLVLKGALGIEAGLGLQEITLDLDAIAGDALTIAICGDNGSGKSTLMNLAMIPWLYPPVAGSTVYEHFGPEGVRELYWSHGTDEYHSLIVYRQTERTRTTKATLQRKNGSGEWEPVRLPNGTLSDGKASTYDTCLRSILGPQSVYYLSAFRQQGARPLSEYSDPKSLMQDLLGLEPVEKQVVQAQEVLRGLRAARASLEDDITRLHQNRQRLDELAELLAQAESERAEVDQNIADIREQVSTKTADLQRAEDSLAAQDEIQRRRQDLAAQISEAGSVWREAMTAIQEESVREVAELARIKEQTRRTTENLKRDVAQAEARIAAHQKVLSAADEIRDAIQALANLRAQRDQASETVTALEIRQREANDLAIAMTSLSATIRRAEADLDHLRARISELEMRHSYVEQVPCHGDGEYSTCPALAEAVAAGELVGDKQADLKRLNDRILEETQRHAEQQMRVAEYNGIDQQVLAARAELEEINQRLMNTEVLAARADALDAAESGITAETFAIVEKQAEIDELAVAEIERISSLNTANIAREERRQVASRVHDERTGRLRELLEAIPAPDTLPVSSLRTELEDLNNRLKLNANTQREAIAKIATLIERATTLRETVEAGKVIEDRSRRLSEQIATWTLLVASLKGVIDLSIEDAGPGIAGIANDLLASAYGPRFTVRIATQRTLENGRTVECFQIRVYDAQTDQESNLEMKSGGQTVWISKAISDAVGIYQQDASGQHYECLFADEAEDGLTQERKLAFWRMDRAALETGGFTKRIFVSHTPAAIEMADAVINLDEMMKAE